jgi:hypothetical protein
VPPFDIENNPQTFAPPPPPLPKSAHQKLLLIFCEFLQNLMQNADMMFFQLSHLLGLSEVPTVHTFCTSQDIIEQLEVLQPYFKQKISNLTTSSVSSLCWQ